MSTVERDAPPADTTTAPPRPVASRCVFVTVGTDHHRFDRLVEWFDDWVDGQQVADHIDGFVQRGTAPAGRVRSVAYLEFEQMRERILAADVVVTHGGPGSIMECRRAGLLPIVCPRDPALGEHVDDHQQLFAARLAAQGQIVLATTREELHAQLDAMTLEPRTVRASDDAHVERTVRRIAAVVDRLVDAVAPTGRTRPPRTEHAR